MKKVRFLIILTLSFGFSLGVTVAEPANPSFFGQFLLLGRIISAWILLLFRGNPFHDSVSNRGLGLVINSLLYTALVSFALSLMNWLRKSHS